MINQAFYLFGLAKTDNLHAWEGLKLEDGSMLLLQPFGDITAVVTKVPVDDFSGVAAEEKFKDTNWLTHKVLEHKEVIEKIMQHSPVLPVQFGTLFLSLENLEKQIAQNDTSILGYFDKVQNHEEWAVKILLTKEATYDYLYQKNLAEVSEIFQALKPGVRYLKEKQLQASTKASMAGFLEQSCQHIVEILSRNTIEGCKREVTSADTEQDGKELVLNLAFLVERSKAASFSVLVQSLRDESSPYGIDITVTGPWPTYSFCPHFS